MIDTEHYVQRYSFLQGERRRNDYQLASFASELRSLFALGKTGDRQFRRWVQEHLVVMPVQSEKLLRMAKTFEVLPGERDWACFADWSAMSRISTAPPEKRDQLAHAAIKKAAELGRPIYKPVVTRLATELGITSTDKRGLGTKSTHLRDSMVTLREFVRRLYAYHGDVLPPMPKAVQKIVNNKTTLEQITQRMFTELDADAA